MARLLAWRRQDFRDYFERHCVQLALAKGDALFSVQRFSMPRARIAPRPSRAWPTCSRSPRRTAGDGIGERVKMCEALYPVLRAHRAEMGAAEIAAAIACSAEDIRSRLPSTATRRPAAWPR